MLTYQLLEYSRAVLQALEKYESSSTKLFNYAKWFRQHRNLIAEEILSNLDIPNYENKEILQLINRFNEVLEGFRVNVKPRWLWNDYDSLEGKLKDCEARNGIEDPVITGLLQALCSTLETYESFLQLGHDSVYAYKFSEEVEASINVFYETKRHFEYLCGMITPYETDVPSENRLKIQLTGFTYSFNEFISILDSINNIYSLLKSVINPEAEDLGIVKIESGSLFAEIVGNAAVVSALAYILVKTVKLVFSKFTKEGQGARNDGDRKRLFEDIELREKLKSLGFDTSLGDVKISDTFEAILAETQRLAYLSPKFKVNDDELDIGEVDKQKLIAASKTLEIGDNRSQS